MQQLSFRKWLLLEGGNSVINNVPADRIDLQKVNRAAVVKTMRAGLKAISNKFKAMYKRPIWTDAVIKSNELLSGSSFHLFSNNLSDEEFLKHKPFVGDIDTQVDKTMREDLGSFFSSLNPGTMVGDLKFIGFKKTDQFITLWNVDALGGLNIQIDFELVGYEDDKPTAWSVFSHSSDWGDIKKGIKGAFHKLLMRAFSARTARDVVIQTKTGRGKERIISSSDLAFSLNGIRKKLKPVLDENGKHLYKDGLPVFNEIDAAGAEYVTDFDILFSSFFGKDGSKAEIEQMGSFDGLIQLMKKHLPKTDQKKVVDRLASILWEKGVQGGSRDDPAGDRAAKTKAFEYLLSQVGGKMSSYQAMIDDYYANYKMTSTSPAKKK